MPTEESKSWNLSWHSKKKKKEKSLQIQQQCFNFESENVEIKHFDICWNLMFWDFYLKCCSCESEENCSVGEIFGQNCKSIHNSCQTFWGRQQDLSSGILIYVAMVSISCQQKNNLLLIIPDFLHSCLFNHWFRLRSLNQE